MDDEAVMARRSQRRIYALNTYRRGKIVGEISKTLDGSPALSAHGVHCSIMFINKGGKIGQQRWSEDSRDRREFNLVSVYGVRKAQRRASGGMLVWGDGGVLGAAQTM